MAPAIVDESWLRGRFGETIRPFDRVLIEPLFEAGECWERVPASTDTSDVHYQAHLASRRRLAAFFHDHPELRSPSFASIGFADDSPHVEAPPPGYEMPGACLPRLPFALTERGSIIGLFSYVIWT